jgi:hypothetical protein
MNQTEVWAVEVVISCITGADVADGLCDAVRGSEDNDPVGGVGNDCLNYVFVVCQAIIVYGVPLGEKWLPCNCDRLKRGQEP